MCYAVARIENQSRIDKNIKFLGYTISEIAKITLPDARRIKEL